MASHPPLIKDITINATWTGDLSSPVNLVILFNVAAKSASRLALIQNNHPSVLSTHVASITKVSQYTEMASEFTPSTCLLPLRALTPLESPSSPTPFSEPRSQIPGDGNWLQRAETRGHASNMETCPAPVAIAHEDHTKQDFPNTRQKSPARNYKAPLSHRASLFDASGSQGSALSPPPPQTLKKLTIPKRLGNDLNCRISPQNLVEKSNLKEEEQSSSPQSIRKRPLSLDKRPPWRQVGPDDTPPRGRRQLGVAKTTRKISRSVEASYAGKGVVRRRRSSLPVRIPKTGRDMEEQGRSVVDTTVQKVPVGRMMSGNMYGSPRQRDATVKVTRLPGSLTADERVERWLNEWRNQQSAAESPLTEAISESERCYYPPRFHKPVASSLSPSPTPSSRAVLPWTSASGIRGGGFMDGMYRNSPEEMPIPTVVNDNGATSVLFQQRSIGGRQNADFLIEICATIKLEAQAFGCHFLAVPGLPLQNGNTEGILNLTIIGSSISNEDTFKIYEKVAYIDENLMPHPFHQNEMSRRFQLDRPFKLEVLCFQACRVLEPSEFEIDADVRTRYEWENLDEDGLTAEHIMICSIRLHPFLMWADDARFNLFLIGGPSGSLQISLEPGNRRIYLDGRRCDSQHELQISLTCPVADLQKTFILSWEQSLGVAPFEVWLPRISGVRRQRLEDIFDLPERGEVMITPNFCKQSRAFSMIAQENFLQSSGEVYFFRENQLTPKSICQSLRKQSGQFYEELTATSLGSECDSEDSPKSLKWLNTARKPSKRQRVNEWISIKHIVPHLGDRPVSEVEPAESGETMRRPQIGATPAPAERKGCTARLFLWPLSAAWWCYRQMASSPRLLMIMVSAWLCFSMLSPECEAQHWSSITWPVKDVWNRFDFQPVQLHGDVTGWKHLVAKVSRGGVRIVDSEASKELEGASRDTEIVMIPVTTREELALSGLEDNDRQEITTVAEDRENDGSLLKLRDKIDLALGWRPVAD